jgi:nicotinamide/nicotinate riboside kinase
LFEGGNVDEGKLDEDVCNQIGVHGMPSEAEGDMTRCLAWSLEHLESAMGKER